MYVGCALCNLIIFYNCLQLCIRHMLRLYISDWESGSCMPCAYCVCDTGTCVYICVFMHIKVDEHSVQYNVIHAYHRISPSYLCEHPVDVINFARDAYNMVVADNSPAT